MNTAECLVRKLTESGQSISTAESCTGGMVASRIVDVSGASLVFEEGYVTYSNRVKQKLLGVQTQTLVRYTEVSSQTAEEMAAGMAEAAETDLSLSVTGYAGPDDGEDGTPAGTVYIGTCYHGDVLSKKYCFAGNRQQVREQAAEQALQFALERIQK